MPGKAIDFLPTPYLTAMRTIRANEIAKSNELKTLGERRMITKAELNSCQASAPQTKRAILRRLMVGLLLLLGAEAWPNNAQAKPFYFTRLKSTTATCAQAQIEVQKELRGKGAFSPSSYKWGNEQLTIKINPSMTIRNEPIHKLYYNAPVGRAQELAIQLSGDISRIDQGVLSSPVYLSSLAARIMEACPSIGLVRFRDMIEGSVPVGYFDDNTARTFQLVDPGSEPHTRSITGRDGVSVGQYEWGYFASP